MKKQRAIFIFYSAVLLLVILSLSKEALAFTLPDAGQTKCYDTADTKIACAGTGQDGAYSINPMSYTDNGNGTITDNVTGLIWQKGENATYYNWYQASGTYSATDNPSSQSVCSSLTLGGQSGWRLPTKKELMSIVDYSIPYPGPTINTTYFPNTYADIYWSSTTKANSTNYAWIVHFYYGNVSTNNKSRSHYFRCVRGGQSGSLGTLAQNNCAASVSSSPVVNVPIVTYSGSNYWADLQYNSTTGQLTVANAGAVTDASSYSSCTASTLSSDFKLHVPVVMLSGVSYWLDLQWNGSVFAVAGGGAN